MQEFLQNIINGLALGGVYALVALGYTMVYGVLQFINFAHSDIFMLGCFGGIYLANWFSFISNPILKMIAVTIGSMLFCTLVGLTVERIAYPLKKSPSIKCVNYCDWCFAFFGKLGAIDFWGRSSIVSFANGSLSGFSAGKFCSQ